MGTFGFCCILSYVSCWCLNLGAFKKCSILNCILHCIPLGRSGHGVKISKTFFHLPLLSVGDKICVYSSQLDFERRQAHISLIICVCARASSTQGYCAKWISNFVLCLPVGICDDEGLVDDGCGGLLLLLHVNLSTIFYKYS